MVLSSFSPLIGKSTWIYKYFPFFWDHFNHFPTAKETAETLGNCTNLAAQIIPFELPSDLSDNFAAAAWRNPHFYLNPDYRSNISSFRMTDPGIVDNSVEHLSSDLECGHWKELHGKVLNFEKYDADYCFIFAKCSEGSNITLSAGAKKPRG